MQSELPACGRYCFLLPIAGHEKFLARDTKKRVAQEKSCPFVKSFGSCKDLDDFGCVMHVSVHFCEGVEGKGGGQGVQKMPIHSGQVQNFAQQGAAAPALEKPS